MTVPLVVLAVLSVVGGLVGLPMQAGGHAFERWLAPVFGARARRRGGAHHDGARAAHRVGR